jgi:hypothetical protein
MIVRLAIMRTRGRALRLTAVSALVVLALTGFSTGRGHGHGGSGDGGGGGGCSSSAQDHDSSSSSSGGGGYRDYDDDSYDNDSYGDDPYDDDDDPYGGSGGSSETTGPAMADATVKLVSCATPAESYATVEVTNPNDLGAYFTVTVDFLDARSKRVERRTASEFVAAGDTAEVQVNTSNPGVAERVDHCRARDTAPEG